MCKPEAFKTYEDRCKDFGVTIDDELDTALRGALKVARLTIIEFNLLKAMKVSEMDIEEAQAMVNGQINFKSLQRAQITTQDVHPCMWRAAQQILKGKVAM